MGRRDKPRRLGFQVNPINPAREPAAPPSPPGAHRPLSASPLAQKPPTPRPMPADTESSRPPEPAAFAFRFNDAPSALAFLAPDAETVTECWHLPADGTWWVPAAQPSAALAAVAEALDGTAWVRQNDRYTPRLRDHGTPVPIGTLVRVPLPLAAGAVLPAGTVAGGFSGVTVVTSGPLARTVLRRVDALPADITLGALERVPLGLDGEPRTVTSGDVTIQVTAHSGMLPAPVLESLAALPRTVVCHQVDRLLIDVRLAPPIPARLLAGLVPGGRQWLVGGVDVGCWQVTGERSPVPVPYEVTVAAPVPAHAEPGAVMPEPPTLTVRLRTAPGGGTVDAVLLDDAELRRLVRFLTGRPLGETAFLVLGPGRHLLTEPARLLTEMPFGVPLHRIGPGGLYLEVGHAFEPAMPPAARQDRFALTPDTAVVVCTDGAYRLDLAALVPAWSYWLGEVPAVAGGLSPAGRAILDRLEEAGVDRPSPEPRAAERATNRGALLEEAIRFQNAGRLAEAARRLEDAGELYRAAVMYRRAAEEAEVR
jgi:hypothetical protein